VFIQAGGVLKFYSHKLSSLFLGGSLTSLDALSHDTLHPARICAHPPAVFLPGELEKVRAMPFDGCINSEVDSLRGARRLIGATRRFQFRNAVIACGHVFTSNGTIWLSSTKRVGTNAVSREYTSVSCRSSKVGSHFFGDWLRDDAATHLLIEDSSENTNPIIGLRHPDWQDQDHYNRVLNQSYEQIDFAFVRDLTIFDDIHQNEHKAERLRRLRVKALAAQTPTNFNDICYLQREGGASRKYGNEDEVISILENRGVAIVRPGSASTADLMQSLAGARVVIGIEGSHLAHAMMVAKNGGGILVIQPPNRFMNSYYDWASAVGMRYGFVVADEGAGGHQVCVNRLLKTLDALIRAL
jgi:hypothetical protein